MFNFLFGLYILFHWCVYSIINAIMSLYIKCLQIYNKHWGCSVSFIWHLYHFVIFLSQLNVKSRWSKSTNNVLKFCLRLCKIYRSPLKVIFYYFLRTHLLYSRFHPDKGNLPSEGQDTNGVFGSKSSPRQVFYSMSYFSGAEKKSHFTMLYLEHDFTIYLNILFFIKGL